MTPPPAPASRWSLKARVAAAAAVAVAVGVLLASLGAYLVTARTLVGEVDRELRELAREVATLPRPVPGPRAGRFGLLRGFVQVIDGRGAVQLAPAGEPTVPVTDAARRVAAEGGRPLLETVDADGVPLRVLTVPLRGERALQVARPMADVDRALAQLRRRLLLGSLVGVGLAALLGTVAARRALRPVDHLTAVAEEVARTADLTRRIGLDGRDEIGRLAAALDTMLARLQQARAAQQQLVADASHELRTPLTSLRTNIEVLLDAERLDPAERRALVRDVVAQIEELSRLIDGLVELTRGARPLEAPVPVRLDELTARVVDRLRPFARGGIRLEATPVTVVGEPDRLERAVANLVDNAIKYGGQGPVEVSVRGDGPHAVVSVRDHGPGIPPEHRRLVFERFWRAPEARAQPGSGLGLAIVAQVAAAHHGTVDIDDAPGGGAVLHLRLPAATPAEDR